MDQEKLKKHHVGVIEHGIRHVLHGLELTIACLTLVVLVCELGLEVYRMAAVPNYFSDVNTYLHNILTIVVGLEFVRMLIDMTPGNTLEVLVMATARHIIMNHESNMTLLIGIVCIAALFATRRFLIRKSELTEDLVEVE